MRYYQSAAMAETCLLPFTPFARLVREIASEGMAVEDMHKWERDALICLQLFTEHILIMIFEMTYSFFVILLIPRNKIAIHAKRKTIMDHDSNFSEIYGRLLRQNQQLERRVKIPKHRRKCGREGKQLICIGRSQI